MDSVQHSVFSNSDVSSVRNASSIMTDDETEHISSAEQEFVDCIRHHHPSVDNKYRFQFHLGCGSFGHVLGATDEKGNWRAVKIIEEHSLTNDQNKTSSRVWRLIQEIACMRKCIGCPSIVQLYDYFEDVSVVDQTLRIFLVMEFCEGDLEEWRKSYDNITEEQASCIFFQMVEACAFMEQQKIIHRDIKTENVLISRMDQQHPNIKLCDFGMGEVLDFVNMVEFQQRMPRFMTRYSHIFPKQRLTYNTFTKGVFGSPLYMCPEMFHHCGYSFGADVWSLGILFYMLLYGISPYVACKSYEQLRSHVTGPGFHIRYPNERTSPVKHGKIKLVTDGEHNRWKQKWNILFRTIFVPEYSRCLLDDLMQFYHGNGYNTLPDGHDELKNDVQWDVTEDALANTDMLSSFVFVNVDDDKPIDDRLLLETSEHGDIRVPISGLLKYVIDEDYIPIVVNK